MYHLEPSIKERCMELYKPSLPLMHNRASISVNNIERIFHEVIEPPEAAQIEGIESLQEEIQVLSKHYSRKEDFADQHGYFDGLKNFKVSYNVLELYRVEFNVSSFTKIDRFRNSLFRLKPFCWDKMSLTKLLTYQHLTKKMMHFESMQEELHDYTQNLTKID
jgi:hypothetical protein